MNGINPTTGKPWTQEEISSLANMNIGGQAKTFNQFRDTTPDPNVIIANPIEKAIEKSAEGKQVKEAEKKRIIVEQEFKKRQLEEKQKKEQLALGIQQGIQESQQDKRTDRKFGAANLFAGLGGGLSSMGDVFAGAPGRSNQANQAVMQRIQGLNPNDPRAQRLKRIIQTNFPDRYTDAIKGAGTTEIEQNYPKMMSEARSMGIGDDSGTSADEVWKNIDALRKEYQATSVFMNSSKVDQAFARVGNMWNNYVKLSPKEKTNVNRGFMDQALIVSFNKMIDPGSVVRESEFARSMEYRSIWNRAKGYMERLRKGGTGLDDTEMADLVKTLGELNAGQKIILKETQDFYAGIASSRFGQGAIKSIIMNYEGKPAVSIENLPENNNIKKGYIEDGYMFIGGDAGDRNNWKKVK